jgi:hypothetical protein
MTMQVRTSIFAASAAALLVASVAHAQQAAPLASAEPAVAAAEADSAKPAARRAIDTQPQIRIQHLRPQDQRGLNVFEPPKNDNVPYDGFRLEWGAAFAQQFQSLDHSNTAIEVNNAQGVNINQLMPIGTGFNNANANLYLNAQLAPGIRVALSTYLSSRHHPEAWVKDGFLLVDASPIDVPALHTIMEYVTLRLGHFQINYGDAQFRRSDNGNTLYNPFIGNYIMDAFTTEIGGEVYFRTGPFLAMGGITGGEIRGQVVRPDDRAPTFLAKLGVDQQLNPDLRVRLTGSMYTTEKSMNNTLYGGDRAGSRYYFVMENTLATEAAQFTSGLINPGLRSEVRAFQVNPFVKFGGLELFGVIERAEGRAANETAKRTWNQYAVDGVFRFLPEERLYVAARYNTVDGPLFYGQGPLAGTTHDVSANRVQLGAGWFVTPGLLLKGEYVSQRYNDFPSIDIRNGGRFNGLMIEGVVSF